ncbi:MAG: ATP-binding cassette domain-containing protein [Microcoleus sp. PH2017_20_SFW_D_A]|nr:ATP-binding cassette domain-containing protein [Microcoleus sp. PH2017_20_SFW_D_A]
MIEVEHLSKTYGSTAAIADVSFSVEAGEILGFLGPNGAGKTTTMRILSGYLPASSGTARIAGLDVHENSMAVRQRIGYLPENPPLYPEMSVEGFLFFVARIKQVPAGDRARRVTSAIERCGLVDKRKVLIRKLSKGFRQRVGIAQAIVHDPPVIILDEPTVGLDPRQIIEVRNLIKSLAGEHTIILSTHILPEVSMTCSRVTIINRGQIVAAGTPERLMGELATGEGYEVEVEGEADLLNSLLLPSLENVRGVRSIELIPSQQFLASRYRLRAECESEVEPGREIAAAIIASGFGLCEMRRNRATLEDVFLRLTAAQKKPEESLVHSEPEVDRNLQAATEIQDSIADSHQSESAPIVENLVSDRQESVYDAHPVSDEPVLETLESLYDAHPVSDEPVLETLESDRQESLYDAESVSEPVVETVESIAHSDSGSEPVVETVESIAHSDSGSEPVVETVESIAHSDSGSEPVVETVESIAHSESHSESVSEPVVETVESIAHSQPEPIVDNLEVAQIPESIEHSDSGSEPVVETVESIAHSQPEPIVDNREVAQIPESIELAEPASEPEAETVESLYDSHSASETLAETSETINDIEPEMQPVAEFLQIVERQESSELSQPKSEPVAEIVELSEPVAEPVAEIVESIEPKSEPVAQIVESIELSQLEPVAEIVESIEPVAEPVAEIVELSEPKSEPVAQIVESRELPQPKSEPVAEPVAEIVELSEPVAEPVAEIVESIEPKAEPVAEILESSQPVREPVTQIAESIELPQPKSEPVAEPVAEILESSEPKAEPVVKNRQVKKRAQPSSDSQGEQPPVNRKRKIERKQQESNDSETRPGGDSE